MGGEYMAERRMISKSIADTDKFLDMPLSTQALYFHLVLRADDDGFIGNPKRILKIIGGSDDDFKILISKGYVLIFESGIIVITHWNQYNHVTKDRYKKTVYSDERKRLKIEKNKVYSLVYTDCIQSGYNVDTQYSPEEISISKKSIDQIKPDQPIQPSVTNMGGAEGTECSQADYDNYLGIIKKNIDYETLIKSSRNSPWYKRQLDEIINIIADVVTLQKW